MNNEESKIVGTMANDDYHLEVVEKSDGAWFLRGMLLDRPIPELHIDKGDVGKVSEILREVLLGIFLEMVKPDQVERAKRFYSVILSFSS